MDDRLLHDLGRRRREELAGATRDSDVLTPSPPLSPEERAAVVQAALDRLDSDVADSVTPFRRASWRGSAAVVTAATLLAAAALVWLALGRPSPSDEQVAQAPHYVISRFEGATASSRSSTADGGEFWPDATIDWVFTPDRTFEGGLAAVLVATAETGAQRTATVTSNAAISPQGAVRLQGRLDAFIALEPGTWTIELLIGPPNVLSEAELATAIEATEVAHASFVVVIRTR